MYPSLNSRSISGPAQVVLYDSKGLEEPRVVYPQDGSAASIVVAAAREDGDLGLAILPLLQLGRGD
jgi:hypothetical protein